MGIFKITYLHHSGFICELEDCILVFDYYMDPEGKLDDLCEVSSKPLYFFVSHFHADHFNPEINRFESRAEGYFIHRDCTLTLRNHEMLHCMEVGDFMVTKYFRIKMFGSTDAGGSFLINLAARDEYFKELERIPRVSMNIVFFPVDARQAVAREWGVKAFLEKFDVSTALVPMHAFGIRWSPSYEFRWRFPDIPLWIPKAEGDVYVGEVK